MKIKKKNIQIECADGFKLAATLYEPEHVKSAIMVAPATGIKKRFYNSFATYLAENGYGVICFENRGIGQSIKGDINKIDATLINWGRLDMTAVLEKLQNCFPHQCYHVIGHSAGGQLVGLMENSSQLKSLFSFASSSGNLRKMSYPFKINAIFYMNIFIPLSNFLFGKTNSQWVGMGEPLPKLVAKQWRKWCNGHGYVATDFGKEIQTHYYDKLKIPSMWLYAKDDAIATLANVNEMSAVYSQSKSEIVLLDPQELDLKQIGHMGFFSSKNRVLWKYAIDWLVKNS